MSRSSSFSSLLHDEDISSDTLETRSSSFSSPLHDKELRSDTRDFPHNESESHEVFNSEKNSNNIIHHDENVEEPKIGMTFDSMEELINFYRDYGKKMGFGVYKRSSQKSLTDEETIYATIACNRAGKWVSKSKNILNPRPISKTNCGAKINVVFGGDKRWHVSKVELKHNHQFSPSKGRFYRCNRVVKPHVKRRLEIYQRVGVRMNKGFNTFVVESGGYENIPFTEKDCRNYIDNVKRLKFGEGDAEAIQSYFTKVQSTDRDFFYTWEMDEENRLKSLFWADARCRAAYEEFGDVVTFDTTYLTNEYEMPMAPFVGVNHHGQSILLGCGLISNEDTATFTWLFKSWLTCMSGRAPNAIITDQDQAMKNALSIVFPRARHRWCLWHILNKLPTKFGSHKKYKSIKFKLKKAVYDSLTPDDFEAAWKNMVERYQLENNNWLNDLYAERWRWVPCFLKDIFWAGMSTTQRSESINAFFDKYVNKKTSLKQFVEQYENALRDRAEKENIEDFNSYNSSYPPITRYAMEEQMKASLTNTKFKEFREELTGKMYCGIGSLYRQDGFSEYEVLEDVMVDENIVKKPFTVWFKMGDSHEDYDVKCICRLFEFRGMLCRHALTVLINENIYSVPTKYILKRWRKDVKRRHTKVRVSYSDWVVSDVGRRYDKMCSAFSEVADLASQSEEKCSLICDKISELKIEMLGEKNGHSSFVYTHQSGPSMKDKGKILSPLVVRGKGRPPSKRLKSKSEQIITRMHKKKNHNELGCGVQNYETNKKRLKNGNEGCSRTFDHVENVIETEKITTNLECYQGNQNVYTVSSYGRYHPQTGEISQQPSSQLQNLDLRMHQSSEFKK